jgi:signal transduction histidine kinase
MTFRRYLRLDTLYARIAGVLILNLILVQLITFGLVGLEVEHVPLRSDLAERIATTVRVLDVLSSEERARVASAVSTPELKIAVLPAIAENDISNPALLSPIRGHEVLMDAFATRFKGRLTERLEPSGSRQIVVLHRQPSPSDPADADAEDQPVVVVISLKNHGLAEFRVQRLPTAFRWLRLATSIVSICVVSSVLSLWFASRLSRRLAQFAGAAEELGRSVDAPPLPEAGPDELRLATRAFNRMQERLRRFVHDRTQMLAAISHDLRTPLTRLRLRAEFVEQVEQQQKMLHDIGEMEAMITATLAFARDDMSREPRREEDLDELLDGICEGMRETGQDIRYAATGPILVKCNPLALRRAFGNLFDNAMKYGQRAGIRLAHTPGYVAIEIEDDGPGIPDDVKDAVFQPFFRLDSSRNRDTGGVGLGLSVARTIIRGHGGDIVLNNRPEGGLRVTVMLPA